MSTKTKKPIKEVYGNHNPRPRKQFMFTQPSMTEPDDDITIQQMMHNVANGLPSGRRQRQPIYTGDKILEEKDISQWYQDQKELAEKIAELEEKMKLEKEEEKLAALKEKWQKEVAKLPDNKDEIPPDFPTE